QRESGAVPVADPSAENLKDQVRIGKGGEDQPDLGIREIQFLPEDGRGGADVDAIDVRDAVHQTQQDQDLRRRRYCLFLAHRVETIGSVFFAGASELRAASTPPALWGTPATRRPI